MVHAHAVPIMNFQEIPSSSWDRAENVHSVKYLSIWPIAIKLIVSWKNRR